MYRYSSSLTLTEAPTENNYEKPAQWLEKKRLNKNTCIYNKTDISLASLVRSLPNTLCHTSDSSIKLQYQMR